MLGSVIISPTSPHTATVIFMHGLGDSGHGWAPVMRMLARSLPFVKFVLPHAPTKAVSLNRGLSMPAWFDLFSLDELDGREDEDGLMQSKEQVLRLIEEEKNEGIPEERIVIGGFSQGAALGLFTALTSARKLAGIVSLSGYVPLRAKFSSLIQPAARSVPVFMGHGTADYVVQYKWGKDSADYLRDHHCSCTFKSYENLDHSCNDTELQDVREFLDTVFGKDAKGDL